VSSYNPYAAPDPQPPQKEAIDYIAPVNVKNALAMVSGWLGLLSIVCFGPLLGIPAVITGVLALKKPQLGGKGRAWTGIIAGTVSSIVWLILVFAGSTKP